MTIKQQILPWIDQAKRIKPTAIVLHWWQMPSWLVGIKWFKFALKRKNLSVQFAVMKDGIVYQFVESPDVWCHHARCANDSSIGIEIQGLGAKELDRQPAQFDSVVELVSQLCEKFQIQPEFRFQSDPEPRFFGVASHKLVDQYCKGTRIIPKRDVHDDYLKRVVTAVQKGML